MSIGETFIWLKGQFPFEKPCSYTHPALFPPWNVQGHILIICFCGLLCKYMQMRIHSLSPHFLPQKAACQTHCSALGCFHLSWRSSHISTWRTSRSFLNSCIVFHCLSTRVYSVFELCPIFCCVVGTQVCICGINSRNGISVLKDICIVILINTAKWSSHGGCAISHSLKQLFSASLLRDRWCIIVVIVCISLCMHEMEHLFMCWRHFVVLFLWNVFAHFYIGLLALFSVSRKSSYNRESHTLSVI